MAYDASSADIPWSAADTCRRAEGAFTRFAPYRMLCQVLADVFYPERADFIVKRSPGEEQYADIFDGEPQIMRRDLANQLGSVLRRRGSEWFTQKVWPVHLNKNDRVKKWCESNTATIRDVIYNSKANFTMAMAQSDSDYVAFGSAVVSHNYLTDPDSYANTGLAFACLHLRDCAWYENAQGVIDEFYEKITKTRRQLVEMFGLEALPDEWQRDISKHGEMQQEIVRVVLPKERCNDGRGFPRDAKFASIYVVPALKHELLKPGGKRAFFKVWPYLVRRWTVVSGEPWGRSPCSTVALADSRMLQQAQIAIIDSLEKMVNPVLLAPDEGVSAISLRGGGLVTFDPEMFEATRGRPPVTPLETGRPDYGMQFSAERRQFLARAFMQNLLKLPPIDGNAMTATEVNERIEEYVRQAAPIFEPMEAENALLMEGVFTRMMQWYGPAQPWGLFDVPPPELQEVPNAEVRFEFETPLAAAMRKLRAEQARQVAAFVAEQVQSGVNPGAVDHIDWDTLTRDAITGLGPAAWLVNIEDVATAREAKAQAQQISQAANLAMSMAHSGAGRPGAPPQITDPSAMGLAS